jgi:hypothetical protein
VIYADKNGKLLATSVRRLKVTKASATAAKTTETKSVPQQKENKAAKK